MAHFFSAAEETLGFGLESIEVLFGKQGRMRVLPQHRRFETADPAPLAAAALAQFLGEAVYLRYSDTSNSVVAVQFSRGGTREIRADSRDFQRVAHQLDLPFTDIDDLFDSFYAKNAPVQSYQLVREHRTLSAPERA